VILGTIDLFVLSTTICILTILTSSMFSFSHDLKFLVLSISCFFFFSKDLVFRKSNTLVFSKIDIAFITFSFIGLLSFLWSINGSLTWYPALGWLLMFCWMILIRRVSLQVRLTNYLHKFFLFFLFLFIGITLFYAFTGLPIDESWVRTLGNNSNYTSSLIISLLPFGLFLPKNIGNKTFRICVAFVLSISALLLIFYTSARACLLAFIVLIFLKLYIEKYFKTLILGLILLSLFGFLVFGPFSESLVYNLNQVSLFSDFKNTENIGRIYLLNASLWLFQENPLLGIGMGNWQLEAYKFDLSDVAPFNSLNFLRHPNHNLYATVLAESGLIGFSFLFLPILYILFKSFKRLYELCEVEFAFLLSIIAYLLTSIFYGSVNFHDGHFSEVQWIAFTGFGILSSKFEIVKMNIRLTKYVLAFLPFFCLLWFSYAAISNNQLYAAKYQIERGNYNLGVLKMKSVYNPVFKTFLHKNQSIPFLIAKSYEELGDLDNALSYYETALQNNPYDANMLFDYSTLLYDNDKFDKSFYTAKELLKIDSKNRRTNMLLSKLSLKKSKLMDTRAFLNKAYHPWNTYEVNMVEQTLYKEGYLLDILNFNSVDKLNQLLENFDPEGNLEKMKIQPWKEINIPIVRSIYDFEFGLYNILDSTNYEIYLRDRLSARVNHELVKIKKDFDLDIGDIEAMRKDVLEYAIIMEHNNLRKKLKLSEHINPNVSLTNIEIIIGKNKMGLFLEKLNSYNFGRFLFCSES